MNKFVITILLAGVCLACSLEDLPNIKKLIELKEERDSLAQEIAYTRRSLQQWEDEFTHKQYDLQDLNSRIAAYVNSNPSELACIYYGFTDVKIPEIEDLPGFSEVISPIFTVVARLYFLEHPYEVIEVANNLNIAMQRKKDIQYNLDQIETEIIDLQSILFNQEAIYQELSEQIEVLEQKINGTTA